MPYDCPTNIVLQIGQRSPPIALQSPILGYWEVEAVKLHWLASWGSGILGRSHRVLTVAYLLCHPSVSPSEIGTEKGHQLENGLIVYMVCMSMGCWLTHHSRCIFIWQIRYFVWPTFQISSLKGSSMPLMKCPLVTKPRPVHSPSHCITHTLFCLVPGHPLSTMSLP